MDKELETQIQKLEAKLKAKKKLAAQAAKAKKAKDAAVAAQVELRKDALLAAMVKATMAAEISSRMDAYLVNPEDRRLFGLNEARQ